MHERTFIGLDVHARSVQAGVLDGLTGEVKSLAVPEAVGYKYSIMPLRTAIASAANA
jgi:hypothetical protein